MARLHHAALIAVATAAIPSTVVFAGPQDGQVKGGVASITEGGGTTTISQSSNKAIIDWRSFSIGAGEHVVFVQPDGNAIALNRVTGRDRSDIQGSLSGNGHVWLVNPNGVVFGPGATVDVQGLVASTADIRDDRFLAGDYRFDTASADTAASIVNQGTITLRDHGLAALVAPNVRNDGIIQGRSGTVVVAGVPTFAIDLQGDNLLYFAATSQVVAAPTDGRALVDNRGDIIMDGGTVMLTAEAAAGIVDEAINTSGLVQARAVDTRGGSIVLISDGAGAVVVDGALDATGVPDGAAGTLYAAGRSVDVTADAAVAGLLSAEITATENLTIDSNLAATNDLSLSGPDIRIGGQVSSGGDVRLRGVDIATTGDGLIRSARLDIGSTATAAQQADSNLVLNTDTRSLAIGTSRRAAEFANADITNEGDLHVGAIDSQGVQVGSLRLETDGILTLDQPIRATGQDATLVAVTGGFVNNAGPDALQTASGHAVVYSVDASRDSPGALSGEVLYGNVQNVPPPSINLPGIVFVYQNNPNEPPITTPPPLTNEEVVQATQPDVLPDVGLTGGPIGSVSASDGSGRAAQIETALIRVPPVAAAQEEEQQRDLLFANDGNRDLWGLTGGR